ncbi:LCP family protein [Tessaracoccus sp. Y1736]
MIGFIAVGTLFLAAVPLWAYSGMETWEHRTRFAASPDQTLTLLIIGTDSRAMLSDAEIEEMGTTRSGDGADTILILQRPRVGPPVLLSVPRDLLVDMSFSGEERLTTAFDPNRPEYFVEGLSEATGIRFDGAIMFNFGSVTGIVDAVGGVDVCLEAPLVDRVTHLELSIGCHTLDGITALAYMRTRQTDALDDLGRINRQREVLGLVAHKLASPATVLPWRYAALAGTIRSNVQRTDTVTWAMLGDAASTLQQIASGEGVSTSLPVGDWIRSDFGNALEWDPVRTQRVFDAIASGDTTTLAD